jgi:hypothetical protein
VFGIIIKLHNNYGFIRGDDNINRFFIPSGLDRSAPNCWGITFDDLVVDSRVSFDHEDAPRGPRAVNIRIIGGDAV